MICKFLIYKLLFDHFIHLIDLFWCRASFEIFESDYGKLNNHLIPFTMGFLTAWAYKNNKTSFLKNSFVYYGLYILSLLSCFVSLAFPGLFEAKILAKNDALFVTYFSIKRLLFIAPFAYIFLTFRFGPSKLKSFLSLKVHQPISKLCSSLVIVQFLYFFYFLSTRRAIVRYTIENLLREFTIALIFIFISSNGFYFFFESPLFKLIKQLLFSSTRRSNDQKIAHDTINNRINQKFNELNSTLSSKEMFKNQLMMVNHNNNYLGSYMINQKPN